jgi:hypothetical protein
MNHRPFEEWLLNELELDTQQQRELDLHLRSCAYCAALVKTDKVLRSMKVAVPAPGFAVRFANRLAVEKAADRRRRILGAIFFMVGGLVLMGWMAFPYLAGFLQSPASWIAALVEMGVFLWTTAQASAEAGAVILEVLGSFVPPFGWMVILSGFAGVGLLWSVSIWRFVRAPQGV